MTIKFQNNHNYEIQLPLNDQFGLSRKEFIEIISSDNRILAAFIHKIIRKNFSNFANYQQNRQQHYLCDTVTNLVYIPRVFSDASLKICLNQSSNNGIGRSDDYKGKKDDLLLDLEKKGRLGGFIFINQSHLEKKGSIQIKGFRLKDGLGNLTAEGKNFFNSVKSGWEQTLSVESSLELMGAVDTLIPIPTVQPSFSSVSLPNAPAEVINILERVAEGGHISVEADEVHAS